MRISVALGHPPSVLMSFSHPSPRGRMSDRPTRLMIAGPCGRTARAT